MEIKATKLLGLNFTVNPKDLKDHELSDMTNLQLLKTGELVRRKGLRIVNSSQLENYYPREFQDDGTTAEDPRIQVINNTSRIKYNQLNKHIFRFNRNRLQRVSEIDKSTCKSKVLILL